MKWAIYLGLMILGMGCEKKRVFEAPPKGFEARMEVASCFCEEDGKVLFLLRSPQKVQGNTWCLPGGKLEEGESAERAVVREVFEETGLQIGDDLEYCKEVFVRLPTYDIILHMFRARVSGEVALATKEHVDYRWVTIEEALKLKLIPGGTECVRVMKNLSQ